jgi:hypothetical protein
MYPDVGIAQRVKSTQKIVKSFLYYLLHIQIMLMFEENTMHLQLPLKYYEMIHVTFVPDMPGPIVPSICETTKSPETPKEKCMCIYFMC